MLRIFTSLSQLNFGKLMEVYEEGNAENAAELYPAMDKNAGILQAEQDFYAYLEDCFFKTEGAFYAVWQEKDAYRAALRMEPYGGGYLLAALETAPPWRRQGYASHLILAVLERTGCPVFSHVNKRNEASLRTHLACGFSRVSESAEMIDGSVSEWCCTLRWG